VAHLAGARRPLGVRERRRRPEAPGIAGDAEDRNGSIRRLQCTSAPAVDRRGRGGRRRTTQTQPSGSGTPVATAERRHGDGGALCCTDREGKCGVCARGESGEAGECEQCPGGAHWGSPLSPAHLLRRGGVLPSVEARRPWRRRHGGEGGWRWAGPAQPSSQVSYSATFVLWFFYFVY
jgi:hypothetical protein